MEQQIDFSKRVVGKYSIEKLIGQGNWADVYSCVDRDTSIKYAVKVTSELRFLNTPKLKELIRAEIAILRECNNDNVIKLIDQFTHRQHQFMVMEYCNGGDLRDLLIKEKNIVESQAVEYLKQILNGFKGLHEVRAMHRDFKIENVLLHNKSCKIADLGFGKQLQQNQTAKTKLGSNFTMAPEVMKMEAYDFKADIWSIGVVFYQLLFGDYPFSGRGASAILQKAIENQINFSLSNINVTAQAQDFIRRCLVVNVKDRISWSEIYEHPLITDCRRVYFLGPIGSRTNIEQNTRFYKLSEILDFKPKEAEQFMRGQQFDKSVQEDLPPLAIEVQKQQKIGLEQFSFEKSKKQVKDKSSIFMQEEQFDIVPQQQVYFPGYVPKRTQPKSQNQMKSDRELSKMVDEDCSFVSHKRTSVFRKISEIEKLIPYPPQIEQQLFTIEKMYGDRMNNIMFAVRQIFIRLDCIQICTRGIDHLYYTYLLLTDCQMKLRRFIDAIDSNQNIFNVQENFQYFVELKKDTMVKAFKAERNEIISWLKDMIKTNNSLKAVFQNSKEMSSYSWGEFMRQKLQSYQILLSESLDSNSDYQQQLMLTIYCVKQFAKFVSSPNFEAAKIEQTISRFDFSKAYQQIQTKITKIRRRLIYQNNTPGNSVYSESRQHPSSSVEQPPPMQFTRRQQKRRKPPTFNLFRFFGLIK